jgi:hypothetical protein
MGTDICEEVFQKLQWISGGGVGSEAGIRVVKVWMRDLTGVAMSALRALDSGTSSDVVEKLHGAWCCRLVCILWLVGVWYGGLGMTFQGLRSLDIGLCGEGCGLQTFLEDLEPPENACLGATVHVRKEGNRDRRSGYCTMVSCF